MNFSNLLANGLVSFAASHVAGVTAQGTVAIGSELHDYVSKSKETRFDQDYPEYRNAGYLKRCMVAAFKKPTHARPVREEGED